MTYETDDIDASEDFDPAYAITLLLTDNRRFSQEGTITLSSDEAAMIVDYVMNH
jgi:hypothetical protein